MAETLTQVAIGLLERVLADEESGEGWGPDVTTVGLIRKAIAILSDDPEAVSA